MNEFYFTPNPTTESKPVSAGWTHEGKTYTFQTDSGVFSRGEIDYGSYLLAEALPPLSGDVLDMGCGYGFLGIAAALRFPGIRLTMADINERAVALAKENARTHKIGCTVLQGDGFSCVEGLYDFILINPPIRAGKAVYYAWFEQAHAALKEGGRMIIVMHKKHGALSAAAHLRTFFTQVDTLDKSAGYHVFSATK